ncbi:hypothetical protein P2H44_07870 [Albimonas sp. CAU 1670]|uniref:hypothetical protein n=1 Tax=Albimonas sp. CAU 1670 TaxID=3032599 RepID=UPI0023DC85A7|nr:hypothetical protein [Albimonas sp. CAU 1670]MDF2232467.1 hypothetical protein [Albimonas sp. CAU 1670]
MAGTFTFSRKVNFKQLIDSLTEVDGDGDATTFEGQTADGTTDLFADGAFLANGHVAGTATSIEFSKPGGGVFGAFGGTVALDTSDGGFDFAPPLSGGVTVLAGRADDRLTGLRGGDDSVDGGGGDDVIDGGGGNDGLSGGGGADAIFGRGGFDVISGDGGKDVLKGGGGGDFLTGGGGDDELVGGGGIDNLDGGGGDDVLRGDGDGVGDFLRGGAGNDRLIGDAGDNLIGDAGADTIISRGGKGVFIDAGSGKNRVFLEDGRRNAEDVGFLFGDDGKTVIKGADEHDRFEIFANLSESEADSLFGTANEGKVANRIFEALEDSFDPGGRKSTCSIDDMDLVFRNFDGPPGSLPDQFEVTVFIFPDTPG